MKPRFVPFNPNHAIRVRLTDTGRRIDRERHDALARQYRLHCGAGYPFAYIAPKEDARGWSEWQAWQLIETFGGSGFSAGMRPEDYPFHLNVKICLDE